jgi:hypothetical protein
MEAALLLEIDGGSDHGSHRDDHQQSADELLLELPHTRPLDTFPQIRLHVNDHPKFGFF